MNALFYTNDYIDKRYEELEGYEFLISLPKSIFSFLIASVIGFIYGSLTSSKKTIEKYFEEEWKRKLTLLITTSITTTSRTAIQVLNNDKIPLDLCYNINANNDVNKIKITTISNVKLEKLALHLYTQIETIEKMLFQSQVIQPVEQSLKEKIDDVERKKMKILLCIKANLIIFFIGNMVLMLIFWYYATSFCIVIKNSQLSWSYGWLKSLGFSILVHL